MDRKTVYLDNAATTALDSEVLDVMLPLMKETYGNPSSVHTMGLDAHRELESVRERCAEALKTRPDRIVFTSCGSESNNLLIKGLLPTLYDKTVIASRLEHPSVLEPLRWLEKQGICVRFLENDDKGYIDQEQLRDLLGQGNCGLLSLIHGSNEVGTIQDITAIGATVRTVSPRTWFHLDAVQSVGHMAINPKALAIDSLTLSGHKIHGPKGTGMLALYNDARLSPIIAGGGQEGGNRSGTQNLPAIAGAGLALERALKRLPEAKRIETMRNRLLEGIRDRIQGVRINGDPLAGLPHILSVSFTGLLGEVLLHHLEKEGIMVSTGSACHARWTDMSATLKALRVPKQFARGTLRFSLSRHTTEDEIDYTIKTLEEQVRYLREVGL